jgi:sugar lactone lactonase YvrE
VELRLCLLMVACSTFERQPTFNDGGVSTTPQVLSDHRAHPQDLVLHGGYAFWVDQGSFANGTRDGQLLRIPVDGCRDNSCTTILAGDLYSPGGVTVSPDGASLYFCELADASMSPPGPGRIWYITFGSNEQPYVFGPGQGGPVKVAADETALYWVNNAAGEVRRQWLDQGTPGGVAIADNQSAPVELTVDVRRQTVFWTNSGSGDFGGVVQGADVDGANRHTLGMGQASPRGISVGPTYVYWANAGNGTVMRALPGGGDLSAFTSDKHSPNDVLVDGDWLLVAEGGNAPYYQDGRILALRLDGSEERVLADKQRYPRSLAVDAYAVYWVNVGSRDDDQYDGALTRVAKP